MLWSDFYILLNDRIYDRETLNLSIISSLYMSNVHMIFTTYGTILGFMYSIQSSSGPHFI